MTLSIHLEDLVCGECGAEALWLDRLYARVECTECGDKALIADVADEVIDRFSREFDGDGEPERERWDTGRNDGWDTWDDDGEGIAS